jgi:hypothetical protein
MTRSTRPRAVRHVLAIAATAGLAAGLVAIRPAMSQQRPAAPAERFVKMSKDAEAKGLAEPFKGITSDGKVRVGLFPIRSTGVSTEPVRKATEAFLAALTDEQRRRTAFGVNDDEWRKWMNQHFYVRQGVSFEEFTPAQRDAALGMLRAALSAKGLKLSQDVMHLNQTVAEMTGRFDEYGEGRYWITVMGTPSEKEPWGFQVDGHHLNLNYFVLGDQVVMTPAFFGSEPVTAAAGKYKGTAILQAEQEQGLAMLNALNEEQKKKAVLNFSKTGNNSLTEAFHDNVVLDYAGVPGSALSPQQKEQLLALVGLYVGNMADGHAKVKMDDVRRHLDQTYFAWIGEPTATGVFYYRIHSPVILIEFDHQKPIALGDRSGPPSRQHVHTITRTPNGNDYGKDLLRQHYEAQKH